jgi:hypothetical protein
LPTGEEMIMHGCSIASSRLYNYSNNVLTINK